MYTNIDICNPNKLLFITICTLSGILVAIYFDESRRQISENFGESHHCKDLKLENFGESHHCKNLKLENFGEFQLTMVSPGLKTSCKDLCIIMIML